MIEPSLGEIQISYQDYNNIGLENWQAQSLQFPEISLEARAGINFGGLSREVRVAERVRARIFGGHLNGYPLLVLMRIQRAMAQLAIHMIFAGSPQAKERVERPLRTLQGKLIKMFAHKDITTIEQANEFPCTEFIPFWEKRRAVEARFPEDDHRSAEGFDLDAIPLERWRRVVTNDYTSLFHGLYHQIERRGVATKMRRAKITHELRRDGDIKPHFRGKYFHFYRLEKLFR